MEALECPWEVSLTGCSVLLYPKHTLLTPVAETSLLHLSTETFTISQEMFVNWKIQKILGHLVWHHSWLCTMAQFTPSLLTTTSILSRYISLPHTHPPRNWFWSPRLCAFLSLDNHTWNLFWPAISTVTFNRSFDCGMTASLHSGCIFLSNPFHWGYISLKGLGPPTPPLLWTAYNDRIELFVLSIQKSLSYHDTPGFLASSNWEAILLKNLCS